MYFQKKCYEDCIFLGSRLPPIFGFIIIKESGSCVEDIKKNIFARSNLNTQHMKDHMIACRYIQSMRNNLRQLPALTFSRRLAGILRGWDLTIGRNEELHL